MTTDPEYLRRYGITRLTKFPKYVYGTNGNSLLVHVVIGAQVWWYECNWQGKTSKLARPRTTVYTVCGMTKGLNHGAKFCSMPKPDAVMCGKCMGREPTFTAKSGKSREQLREERRAAKIKLGCIAE